MAEELRVDTELVSAAGGRIKGLAEAIPAPPDVSAPGGEDALSAAIAKRMSEVVDPVIDALPTTKEELKQFAQNVVNAADKYDATDRQIAEEILKRIGAFDEPPAHGGGMPTGGSPTAASTSTAAGVGASAGGMAGASLGGSAGPVGGFEQMMNMPMQMAQQAAQMPMQMAGTVGQVPQQLAQGAQGAMEQVTQFSGPAEGDRHGHEDDRSFDGAESGNPPPEPEPQGPSAVTEQPEGDDDSGQRAPVESPSGFGRAQSNSELVL